MFFILYEHVLIVTHFFYIFYGAHFTQFSFEQIMNFSHKSNNAAAAPAKVEWNAEYQVWQIGAEDCFICARPYEMPTRWRADTCLTCNKAMCHECSLRIATRIAGVRANILKCPYCRVEEITPWDEEKDFTFFAQKKKNMTVPRGGRSNPIVIE